MLKLNLRNQENQAMFSSFIQKILILVIVMAYPLFLVVTGSHSCIINVINIHFSIFTPVVSKDEREKKKIHILLSKTNIVLEKLIMGDSGGVLRAGLQSELSFLNFCSFAAAPSPSHTLFKAHVELQIPLSKKSWIPLPRDTNMAAGNRKKTSGVHFCQKRGLFSLVSFRKFRQIFLLILALFRMLKIAGRVILKYGTALAQPSSCCHAR